MDFSSYCFSQFFPLLRQMHQPETKGDQTKPIALKSPDSVMASVKSISFSELILNGSKLFPWSRSWETTAPASSNTQSSGESPLRFPGKYIDKDDCNPDLPVFPSCQENGRRFLNGSFLPFWVKNQEKDKADHRGQKNKEGSRIAAKCFADSKKGTGDPTHFQSKLAETWRKTGRTFTRRIAITAVIMPSITRG